jgi:hypothetical protein
MLLLSGILLKWWNVAGWCSGWCTELMLGRYVRSHTHGHHADRSGQSLSIGRPANLASKIGVIDTQFPSLEGSSAESVECKWFSSISGGEAKANSGLRIRENLMTLNADVAHATLSLKPPSYSKIMELDERVRRGSVLGRKMAIPAIIPPCSISKYV